MKYRDNFIIGLVAAALFSLSYIIKPPDEKWDGVYNLTSK